MRPARACHRPTARPSDPHCRYSHRPLATTGTKPRGEACRVRVLPTILPLSGLAWTSCDASEHRRCAALRKSRQTNARLTEVRLTNRRCSGAFASASGFRDDELPEPRDEPLTGPAATVAIELMIGLSKLAPSWRPSKVRRARRCSMARVAMHRKVAVFLVQFACGIGRTGRCAGNTGTRYGS